MVDNKGKLILTVLLVTVFILLDGRMVDNKGKLILTVLLVTVFILMTYCLQVHAAGIHIPDGSAAAVQCLRDVDSATAA